MAGIAWRFNTIFSYKMHNLKLILTEVSVGVVSSVLGSVGFRKWSHQIQFLALFIGVDRSSLVVVDKLIEVVKLSLADAVHVAFDVNSKVLVPSRRFQRHWEVARLKSNQKLAKERSQNPLELTFVSESRMRKSPSCPCEFNTVSHWFLVMAP